MDPMDYLYISFAAIVKNLFGSSTALVASLASGTSDALREKKKRIEGALQMCHY